jgi:hypothetical protein
MYGYGYVTPFSFEYEANRLSCGIKDFDEALEEYSFLDNPDPETPVALLTYYTTKLNHAFKRKVSCIVSDLFHGDTNYFFFVMCFLVLMLTNFGIINSILPLFGHSKIRFKKGGGRGLPV